MPANRSRTQEWRRCLRQVCDRHGALEIAVVSGSTEPSHHLVWRVRLLELRENEFLVEQPSTLGRTILIEPGVLLVVVLSIGQNRWMFTARNLGNTHTATLDRKPITALRLAMPESVERCQRRNHYRVETASLHLPQVELWPLLDPKSVMLAERASELLSDSPIEEAAASTQDDSNVVDEAPEALTLPEVGPKFAGTLLNIGGGGVGLRVLAADSQSILRHKIFWMRIHLPSAPSTPICATGKLVHTHMESTHDTYAGMAFDFTFNPAHERFVIDQICRYIAMQQGSQFQPLRIAS